MTAVVVAYVPRPEGRAALARGIAEARLRETRLVVVNATRGDALVDERFVQGDVRDDLAADKQLEDVALETGADLIVIGLRRRRPVGKLILGSAASRILLSVSVPVLAVKAAE